MIGTKVGSYEIVAEIGVGGMGVVYRAVDHLLDRDVAIKVLHRHLMQEQTRLVSFKDEAKTLARLNHPNIATLYGLTEMDGEYFMIMEFVGGPTFHKLIAKDGAMSAADAVPLFSQALHGFQHAHSKRVIHRDIKPGNLMVTSDGVTKIMDFGIARHLGTARQTKTGWVKGTYEYMSPEQVQGKDGQDERSDIYSLGIVLYEMLTGQVPFGGTSEWEIMRGHIELKPPSPRILAPDLPKAVERAIERALEKKPDARFQSANEFRETLESALGNAAELKRAGRNVLPNRVPAVPRMPAVYSGPARETAEVIPVVPKGPPLSARASEALKRTGSGVASGFANAGKLVKPVVTAPWRGCVAAGGAGRRAASAAGSAIGKAGSSITGGVTRNKRPITMALASLVVVSICSAGIVYGVNHKKPAAIADTINSGNTPPANPNTTNTGKSTAASTNELGAKGPTSSGAKQGVPSAGDSHTQSAPPTSRTDAVKCQCDELGKKPKCSCGEMNNAPNAIRCGGCRTKLR